MADSILSTLDVKEKAKNHHYMSSLNMHIIIQVNGQEWCLD